MSRRIAWYLIGAFWCLFVDPLQGLVICAVEVGHIGGWL